MRPNPVSSNPHSLPYACTVALVEDSIPNALSGRVGKVMLATRSNGMLAVRACYYLSRHSRLLLRKFRSRDSRANKWGGGVGIPLATSAFHRARFARYTGLSI